MLLFHFYPISLQLGLLVPQPVFITLIVKYLRGNEDVSMQEAYLSAAAVVACTFLYTIPYTMYRYTIGTSAVRARAAISAMIFTKVHTQPGCQKTQDFDPCWSTIYDAVLKLS